MDLKQLLTNSYVSANEIIPGLWLGNEESSQSQDFIQKTGISAIINATKHIPCKWEKSSFNINYLQVPVNDPGPVNNLDQDDNLTMLKYLPSAVNFIDKNLKLEKNILVHCHAGMQRSATIVFAYLVTCVYTIDPTLKKVDRIRLALGQIVKNRPCAFNYGEYSSFAPAVKEYIHNLKD